MNSIKFKLMVAPGGKTKDRRLLRIDRAKRSKLGEDFSLPLSSMRAVLFSVGDAKFMVIPCEGPKIGHWLPKPSTGLVITSDKKEVTFHG